ncbi:MAG: M48 family metalloprotease [Deltaproteobacteria bacterium]|nr:M48 family metalloprotease [Deltaproteobacteria bacterium]
MKTIGKFIPVLLILGIMLTQLAFAGEARKRISASKDEFSDISDIEAEIVFGRELSARILGNYSLIDDEKIIKYVNLVGKALALYAGRPELEFYFGVLDTDEVNAFATPGGYVFITNGALMKMDNEAQLAGVLGHEIAHVVKKHVVKELHIKGDEGSAAGGIAGLIGGTTGTVRVALDQALDDATNILFNRGYKIADEIEADRVGILLASIVGYDPLALKEFLSSVRSFEVEDKTYKGEHPVFEVRMREIDKTLNEHGLKNVKKAKVRDRFYENVKK